MAPIPAGSVQFSSPTSAVVRSCDLRRPPDTGRPRARPDHIMGGAKGPGRNAVGPDAGGGVPPGPGPRPVVDSTDLPNPYWPLPVSTELLDP